MGTFKAVEKHNAQNIEGSKGITIVSTIFLLFSMLLISCSKSIVPDDFKVPMRVETENLIIRPITVADAAKDYEAVMESIEIIHKSFLNNSWPKKDFSLEQNKKDLLEKENRFERKTSFTYTVLNLDESKVLGCIYINEGIGGPDAAVFMWVRQSEYEKGLDSLLEKTVRSWIKEKWPFTWVVYPGRKGV
jgi:hypothetical protein